MPPKRQTAKQRRAAENRARRAALAARTERAHELRPTTRSASSSSSRTADPTAATRSGGATPANLGGGWAGWSRYLGLGTGRREPGVRAAFFALIFALAALVATPFIPVSVDDRGEQVPVQFGGLFLEARSVLTGNEVEADRTTLLDANGAGIFVYLAVPLLVVIASFVYFRRTGRSLPLTIGMLALAVLVMIAGSIYFLPSMIALAIGSFQVRRVEMATRAAEQAAAGGGGADDAPEEEDEGLDEDEDFEEDGYEEDEEGLDDETYAEDDYEDEDGDLDEEDADYEDEDVEGVEDVEEVEEPDVERPK